jgi:hypothetical protein
MRRHKWLLAASKVFLILVLPFLGACEAPFKFGPVKFASSHHFEFDDNTTGGLMGEAEATLLDARTESVIVGFEHFSDTGGPIPRIHNHIHRGAVKFNVALLSEPPKKTITKATLLYSIQAGKRAPEGGFIESCATRLLVGNGEWNGIPNTTAPDTIAGDPLLNLPEALMGARVPVDVTTVVKEWTSGKRANNGFVFTHHVEQPGLFRDNNACWTMIGDFVLQVEYTKP